MSTELGPILTAMKTISKSTRSLEVLLAVMKTKKMAMRVKNVLTKASMTTTRPVVATATTMTTENLAMLKND